MNSPSIWRYVNTSSSYYTLHSWYPYRFFKFKFDGTLILDQPMTPFEDGHARHVHEGYDFKDAVGGALFMEGQLLGKFGVAVVSARGRLLVRVFQGDSAVGLVPRIGTASHEGWNIRGDKVDWVTLQMHIIWVIRPGCKENIVS